MVMDYISQHSGQIRTFGILLLILTLVYSSIKRSFVKIPVSKEPEGPGPYTIPLWEQVLQIFLILGTAVYALWQFGLKRFIAEESQKGGSLWLLIFTIIMAVLFVFGYYMSLIYSDRKNLEASLTRRSPQQRYSGYLKIVLIWIAIFLIGLFI